MTKKEIVKQISERTGLTQLKTKEIVQLTFDAIHDTLVEAGRIELRQDRAFGPLYLRSGPGAGRAHPLRDPLGVLQLRRPARRRQIGSGMATTKSHGGPKRPHRE